MTQRANRVLTLLLGEIKVAESVFRVDTPNVAMAYVKFERETRFTPKSQRDGGGARALASFPRIHGGPDKIVDTPETS